jgi:hypothetical protein
MRRGSRRYKNLASRLEQLRQHLLYFLPAPPVSKLSYSDRELDCTRAYIVLAHAEIETFCEELALERAQAAKFVFDQTGTVRPILRRMVTYHVAKKVGSWGDVLSPPAGVVASAFESFKASIKDNHGVRRKNLEKLLFPLGVPDSRLNATWLAEMDSFGINRGGLAHSSVKVQQPPDPLTQLKAVDQLLRGLLDLEQTLSQMR